MKNYKEWDEFLEYDFELRYWKTIDVLAFKKMQEVC